MFVIIWGSYLYRRLLEKGYMHCPRCQRRQPAFLERIERWFHLFFIPLWPSETGLPYYRCDVCGGMFDPKGDSPYDFGDHAEPKTWECPNCYASVPGHLFTCGACKFSLLRGRRIEATKPSSR